MKSFPSWRVKEGHIGGDALVSSTRNPHNDLLSGGDRPSLQTPAYVPSLETFSVPIQNEGIVKLSSVTNGVCNKGRGALEAPFEQLRPDEPVWWRHRTPKSISDR
jgi:hypothetical protein